jgi:hypothetical protein
MVTKGGGNGIPSYKQVVVDRGKGPRSRVFKEPVTSTSGSAPEKNQESNPKKRDRMGKKPEKPIMMRKIQKTLMGRKGETHVNLKQH